ncbi:MAG: hypothetical protein JOY80_10130 [Candidatus Dormibacteraeota bacterium]|nr:hypothetical protein [Candidatus Dormibacteraeota bacterium]
MLAERQQRFAFIVLLVDDVAANTAADIIQHCLASLAISVTTPPVRGLAFFADPAHQVALDRWWAETVDPQELPVYIIDDAPGLEGWFAGVDGECFVHRLTSGEGVQHDRVTAIHADTVEAFAFQVADRFGTGVLDASPPRDPRIETPMPFDLLAAMPTAEPPRPTGTVPDSDGERSTSTPFQRLARRTRVLGRPRRRTIADSELAGALMRRGSTVVVVGSRKGGVGKSSHAAGMALVAGGVLDTVGHSAVVVDANVANPDAWGILNLPQGAATVRETVAALSSNLEPPRPVYATTPALACYPEAREATEYSRAEVGLLASYLRRRHTLIVVDLCNRLPDVTGGPESALAAYWLELADVLVLPTASSKQDFHGVLDFLELPDLPEAVVAYIEPRSRRNRQHELTQRYLSQISSRAFRVVPLPDAADAVRLAGMEGLPVDAASRGLRDAYRELTDAVASVPTRSTR